MLPKVIRDRTPAPHGCDVYLADHSLPYFAEYVSFCWGSVDFESKGDCARPCDRGWSWLEVTARGASSDQLLVFRREDAEPQQNFPHALRIEATSSRLSWLATYFTLRRSPAIAFLRRRGHMVGYGALAEHLLPDGDVDSRWERSRAIRERFEHEALRAFDTMTWWKEWKREDPSGVMRSVVTADRAALPALIEGLGQVQPERRAAYLHALAAISGQRFESDGEWAAWWNRVAREQ